MNEAEAAPIETAPAEAESAAEATAEAAFDPLTRLLPGLFTVHHDDRDVVRRGRSFIALCAAFATITLLLLVPIVLADPVGDLLMSLVIVFAIAGAYLFGIVLARRGRVELAGALVCLPLVLGVSLATILRFQALHDGIWFMVLSLVIAGHALRPRHIGLILGLNLVLTTAMLLLIPEDPGGAVVNLAKIMILDGLLVTVAIAAYINATQARRLFRRQRDALHDLEGARKRAEVANAAKTSFLANMSHELRTPLNAIIGYAELVDEELGDHPASTDLQRIRGAGQHLLGLISDILDLSKIEAGKLEVEAREFDLARFLNDLGELAAPLASLHHNRLEITCELADPGQLHSDPLRLRQVLLNLLGNACKFTVDGTVRLIVRRVRQGRSLAFIVEDSGIGIAAADLDRIFEPFVQADEAPSRRFGGTGLGLTLTRELVQLLGGNLTVTSEAGRGSCFTVSLPARWRPTLVTHSELELPTPPPGQPGDGGAGARGSPRS